MADGGYFLKILCSPFFAMTACVVFLLLCTAFGKRESLPVGARKSIACGMGICLLYFAFLLWLAWGFGSLHPSAQPIPCTVSG